MISNTILFCSVISVLLLASISENVIAKPLKVSADLPFVASLVRAITEDQDSVTSLMNSQVSPHSFNLQPRDLRALQSADLVVVIGEALSPNLARTIENVAIDVPILGLLKLPQLQEHIIRNDNNATPSKSELDHNHESAHGLDPHVWLDPVLVEFMATAIGEQLAKLDPARAELFRANSNRVATELQEFHQQQVARWSVEKASAFVTVHDVTRYFQQRYNLDPVGSLFEDDHTNPSAKHLNQLQELMRSNNVSCVITDQIVSRRWVDTLSEGQSVVEVSINALGSTDKGTYYLNVLHTMSDAFAECLNVP